MRLVKKKEVTTTIDPGSLNMGMCIVAKTGDGSIYKLTRVGGINEYKYAWAEFGNCKVRASGVHYNFSRAISNTFTAGASLYVLEKEDIEKMFGGLK